MHGECGVPMHGYSSTHVSFTPCLRCGRVASSPVEMLAEIDIVGLECSAFRSEILFCVNPEFVHANKSNKVHVCTYSLIDSSWVGVHV
jgi:hypothetical protein